METCLDVNRSPSFENFYSTCDFYLMNQHLIVAFTRVLNYGCVKNKTNKKNPSVSSQNKIIFLTHIRVNPDPGLSFKMCICHVFFPSKNS